MLLVVCLSQVACAWAGEHPVPLEKDFDPGQCVSCHEEKSKGKAVHSAMAMGCPACHEVRTVGEKTSIDLTSPQTSQLCLQCHSDKDPAGAKGGVHPPVRQQCTQCHNPHSSGNRLQLLKPTSGNKGENLCLDCHDQDGEVAQGGSRHAALDMGCETCHVTHKTGDPAQKESAFHLTKAVPGLCLDCHDVAHDKQIASAHRGQPAAAADCTSCHTPHRSPGPKLIQANVHPPFGERACEICHEAPKDGKVALVEGGKRALCYTCHDDKQKQVEQSKAQHPVFMMTDTCTGCHNPHASRESTLLQSSQGRVCAACHEKSTEPVRHGPYDKGRCANCHDPHGAEEPKLLRATGNDLCRGCHVEGQNGVKVEGKAVLLPWKLQLPTAEYRAAPKIGLDRGGERGHPLIGHPVSGRNTRVKGDEAPITCRSCHQFHSAKVSFLMPAAVNDEIQLCEQCHK